jgi:hypothetical protein
MPVPFLSFKEFLASYFRQAPKESVLSSLVLAKNLGYDRHGGSLLLGCLVRSTLVLAPALRKIVSGGFDI